MGADLSPPESPERGSRPGRGRRWKWWLAVPLVLLAVLAALPFFLPAERLRAQIEQQASAALGQPVAIGSLRIALLPVAHVNVTDITLGVPARARIAKLSIVPRLRSLLQPVKVLKRVELSGVEVDAATLAALAAGGGKQSGSSALRIEQIVLRQLELRLPTLKLTGLYADLRLDASGALERAALSGFDGHVELSVLPSRTKAGEFDLTATARDWTLPLGPALRFERVDARASVSGEGLRVTDWNSVLYDGKLRANVQVDWRRDWSMRGQAQIAGVNLQAIGALFTPQPRLLGALHATPSFSLRAREASGLLASMRLAAPFRIEHGLLKQVDLEQAAKLGAAPKPGEVRGTKFDEFSGHLRVTGVAMKFSDLRVSSGALQAVGHVDIDAQGRLTGEIDARVKRTASLVSVPLVVSGTTSDPKVGVSKAALAGAAAGTAVLGPGVGTTVGIKVMQWGKKLFGAGKREDAGDKAPQGATSTRPRP